MNQRCTHRKQPSPCNDCSRAMHKNYVLALSENGSFLFHRSDCNSDPPSRSCISSASSAFMTSICSLFQISGFFCFFYNSVFWKDKQSSELTKDCMWHLLCVLFKWLLRLAFFTFDVKIHIFCCSYSPEPIFFAVVYQAGTGDCNEMSLLLCLWKGCLHTFIWVLFFPCHKFLHFAAEVRNRDHPVVVYFEIFNYFRTICKSGGFFLLAALAFQIRHFDDTRQKCPSGVESWNYIEECTLHLLDKISHHIYTILNLRV